MARFLDKFRLNDEKEDHEKVMAVVDAGIEFKGTNLWILIFAIFVASLGLNVNSTAVIIGAMLISPLMGPIMGMGLGLGVNDLFMLRRAINNYLVATIAALATSTLFFLLSPLNEAHAEILARTSPNIYDVLIALFGGLAGILATSSKQKGNVIPGVAIATALMPPLCTAGYGLATLQWSFFFGAFYLYVINTVFIALATFITIRFLHFPLKHLTTEASEKRASRIVWSIVLVTLLPSIYFGYNMIRASRFNESVNRFVALEATLKGDYLLSKKTDPSNRKIELVYGGRTIRKSEVDSLKAKLVYYGLNDATLQIRQGFSSLDPGRDDNDRFNELAALLDSTEKRRQVLESREDSLTRRKELQRQVYAELKAQYPSLTRAIIQPSSAVNDSTARHVCVVMLDMKPIGSAETKRLTEWIGIRLKEPAVELVIRNR